MNRLIKEFKEPGAAFRGKPFWSWNGLLNQEELKRQIDVMQQMGMGGYFCHSRTGLETEYLGREWFELINACAEKGRKCGMETWLYDEDRWPSGTAGGMVTENPDFRIKYLRLNICAAQDFAWSNGIIAAFSVQLNGQSFTDKQQLAQNETDSRPGRSVLYFTSEEMMPYSFYNGQTYADTMNPEATKEFLRITHEQYAKNCAKNINNGSIYGIFTDEPHHGGIMCGFALQNPDGNNLTPMPKDLFEQFSERFGYSLKDNLPELFLKPDGCDVSRVKWHYCELLCSLFVKNYLTPIQSWCHEHGLIFTGHLLHEDNLAAQTAVNGSMQRGYEHMDAPGVDVLWENNFNRNIVKQLQSAGRQFGKKTLLSELYGCTGWQMTFQNHKAVGDWQSLYGINLRCQHLSWYTMKGEAKRDYPASIFYQSQWYPQYKYVEDYYARLNVIKQDGTPVCDTLIMSPVESLWATVHPGWCGFFSAQDAAAQEVEQGYTELYRLLESRHIDYDFGDEEQMSRLCSISTDEHGALLALGQARYRTLIIPKCITVRRSTLNIARQFASAGGKVIFLCRPEYIDAVPSHDAQSLPGAVYCTPGEGLVKLLDKNPYIDISCPDVALQTLVRSDGIVFIMMNLDRENTKTDVRIKINKPGFAEKWDVRSGDITLAASGDAPELTMDFAPCEELVLFLKEKSHAPAAAHFTTVARHIPAEDFAYCLTEPNIAVLDCARWQLDGGDEQPCTEILKLDRAVRSKLGIPWRNGEMLQPWFKHKHGLDTSGPCAPLEMNFDFEIDDLSAIIGQVSLMLESRESFGVFINGTPLESRPLDGIYIDPCFTRLPIDTHLLRQGVNTVTLKAMFRDSLDLEAIYLLGSFGVRTEGCRCIITSLPRKLHLGSLNNQGLPFYSGAVDYLLPPMHADGSHVFLTAPRFEGACITVHGNGREKTIAFAPYREDITSLVGDDMFLRLHLTRRNTFGPLHVNPPRQGNYGPDTFLTLGKDFLYDSYSLIDNGLLSPIELEAAE